MEIRTRMCTSLLTPSLRADERLTLNSERVIPGGAVELLYESP